MPWVRAKATELFGADLRSLAAFRIVLALLVLADLASRVTNLSAHYADEGVLPREVLLEEGILHPWTFSLNLINGEPAFQALLFGVLALAAVGLLVGYRTRLMTVVVWLLLLSIHFRNPLLSGAGEPLLRLLLFWAMFLPLGAVWSLDRARRVVPQQWSTYFFSLGTVGLFMQIAFMYWFTALQKSGAEWRTDGTALYYALSYDQVATQVGTYLLQFPALLVVLTFATILLEAFGPLLLFCPLFTGPIRTGAVLAFMGLHLGIRLTMDIGIFPWISALCMVCFLPAWFWDKPVATLRTALPKSLTNLAFHLRNAVPTLTRAYHSTFGAGRLFPATTLASGRSQYAAYSAGATAETNVTTKSKDVAGTGAAAESAPTLLRSSLAHNLLAAFFLAYIFCWNLTTVSDFTMPERLEPIGYSFGVAQSWSMFAPFPTTDDGWFVLPGTLRGGQEVDLLPVTHDDFDPHPVSWEKPQLVSGTDENEHWRKYLQSIRQEEYADQRLYFARYICREWNARHTGPERLVGFQITYMSEITQPNYQRSTPQKVVLRDHRCL